MDNTKNIRHHNASLRVLYGDTDAAGVVYNANYLRYFEYGRTEFMRDFVYSYNEIEAMGILLPVTENWIRYKVPAKYDDLLVVETTLTTLSHYKSIFSYRILRNDGETIRLIAKGHTAHAPINSEGRLIRLPEEIFEMMAPFAKETIAR